MNSLLETLPRARGKVGKMRALLECPDCLLKCCLGFFAGRHNRWRGGG